MNRKESEWKNHNEIVEFAWLARIMLHCAYTKVIGIRSAGHLQNAKFFPKGNIEEGEKA